MRTDDGKIKIIFQSHAGSIEAVERDELATRWGLFQSHAGSIEAPSGQTASLVTHPTFNPTLVRLRPSKVGAPEAGGWAFNPTLVRLRPARWRGGTRVMAVFQSHAGSIEAAAVVIFAATRVLLSIPRWFD